MPYNLGKVKAHVRWAAEGIGPAFGISNIGGWRAHGSVPNSDHPKGLALDLMTRSKSVGDRLADYAVRNYKAYGITYVIWYRQIWTPSKGWHPYNGPSPHTDHVHLSFSDKPGNGKPDGPGAGGGGSDVTSKLPVVGDGLKGIADGIKSMAGAALSVGKVADHVAALFLPTNIVRAVAGVGGTLFILIGIFFLTREARNS